MSQNFLFDKKIWITGASSGIGLALANLLSKKQVYLILSARNTTKLQDEAIKLNGVSKNYIFPCDVSNTEQVNEVFDFITCEVGFPDILINCAGVYINKSFEDTTIDDFNYLVNTNFRGYFNTTKCVLPAMIEQKGGTIINISSVTADKIYKNCAIYSATKSAINTMTNCIREEVREHNIKVISLIPGAVATNIWEKSVLEKFGDTMISASEISEVIVSILEFCGSYTSMVENMVITPQNF